MSSATKPDRFDAVEWSRQVKRELDESPPREWSAEELLEVAKHLGARLDLPAQELPDRSLLDPLNPTPIRPNHG